MRVTLAYDARSRLGTLAYNRFDGSTWQRAATGTTTYNAFAQIEQIHWMQGENSSPLHTFTYTYDSGGRLDGEKRTTHPAPGGSPGDPNDYSYPNGEGARYSAKHELEAVTNGLGSGAPALPSFTYSYSGNSNRTSQGGSTVQTGSGNRISQDERWTYTFNAEGNLIRREGRGTWTSSLGLSSNDIWIYTYDQANRLVTVTRSSRNGTPPGITRRVDYKYDPDGRLIERVYDSDGDGTLATADTERYVYDGDNIVIDLRPAAPNPVAVRYLLGDGADQRFARIDRPGSLWLPQFPNTPVHWYVQDRLNSVIAMLTQDGTKANKWVRYRGYEGVPVCECGLLIQADRYEYTGREFDSGTVLQYHRARWYDPLSGRWMSEDPTGFAAGDGNLYRYAGNSPTNLIDADGMKSTSEVGRKPPEEMVRKGSIAEKLGNVLTSDTVRNLLPESLAEWMAGPQAAALYEGTQAFHDKFYGTLDPYVPFLKEARTSLGGPVAFKFIRYTNAGADATMADRAVLGNVTDGWYKQVSNTSAGVGDTVSGGATRRIRQWAGYDDVVDYQSAAYRYGT